MTASVKATMDKKARRAASFVNMDPRLLVEIAVLVQDSQ